MCCGGFGARIEQGSRSSDRGIVVFWKGCGVVTRRGKIGEHLATWGADAIWGRRFDGDFFDWRLGFVNGVAKDVLVVSEEQRNKRSGNVQGGCKDNANCKVKISLFSSMWYWVTSMLTVADTHLVDFGIVRYY